jgi:hypothetical protein
MATQEPPIRFSTFVISLASSGLAHLGQGGGPRDPALARQTLDLLDVLAEKTRGNLDAEETRLLDALRKELSEKLAAAGGTNG